MAPCSRAHCSAAFSSARASSMCLMASAVAAPVTAGLIEESTRIAQVLPRLVYIERFVSLRGLGKHGRRHDEHERDEQECSKSHWSLHIRDFAAKIVCAHACLRSTGNCISRCGKKKLASWLSSSESSKRKARFCADEISVRLRSDLD